MIAAARPVDIGQIPDVDDFVSTEINYVRMDIDRVAKQLEENDIVLKRRRTKLDEVERLLVAFRAQVEQLDTNNDRLKGILTARKRLLADLEQAAL